MLDFLNDIQIFNEENLIFTICIGILITIILYKLLFKEEYISNDIYQCMNKYDINHVYEFPNLLTDEECNKIIELSKDKIKRSTVIGESQKNDISTIRTSSNTFLNNSIDPLMKQINDKIYSIIKINTENYEDLQVVQYKPGQFYKAHWDACDPKKDERCNLDVLKGGLRFATFIIYLNDDMEGGETEIPLINKKIEPEKGKGILFFNLENDLLNRRELSKHAGLPPTKGEKWMCNKWIRLNKFIQ